MKRHVQRIVLAVLILAALASAGRANSLTYAPIPPDMTETKGGGGGGGGY